MDCEYLTFCDEWCIWLVVSVCVLKWLLVHIISVRVTQCIWFNFT